jgi:hypothetical protein
MGQGGALELVYGMVALPTAAANCRTFSPSREQPVGERAAEMPILTHSRWMRMCASEKAIVEIPEKIAHRKERSYPLPPQIRSL